MQKCQNFDRAKFDVFFTCDESVRWFRDCWASGRISLSSVASWKPAVATGFQFYMECVIMVTLYIPHINTTICQPWNQAWIESHVCTKPLAVNNFSIGHKHTFFSILNMNAGYWNAAFRKKVNVIHCKRLTGREHIMKQLHPRKFDHNLMSQCIFSSGASIGLLAQSSSLWPFSNNVSSLSTFMNV